MWEEMTESIRRLGREVLGVFKRGSGRMRGAWWWSEEVKVKVKAKQEKYKALPGSRIDEEKGPVECSIGLRRRRQRK